MEGTVCEREGKKRRASLHKRNRRTMDELLERRSSDRSRERLKAETNDDQDERREDKPFVRADGTLES